MPLAKPDEIMVEIFKNKRTISISLEKAIWANPQRLEPQGIAGFKKVISHQNRENWCGSVLLGLIFRRIFSEKNTQIDQLPLGENNEHGSSDKSSEQTLRSQ